jgi:hypothetical protein
MIKLNPLLFPGLTLPEKELIARATDGKLTASRQQFARLAFGEAADRYITAIEARVAEANGNDGTATTEWAAHLHGRHGAKQDQCGFDSHLYLAP